MRSVITHLTHIVYRHHNPLVAYKLFERLAIHQLKERCSLTNLNALHLVQRTHNILQRSAGIDSTEIGVAHLVSSAAAQNLCNTSIPKSFI